jgi:hypothetical protein
MSVSLDYIERCAAETGYAAVSLEKVTRLGEIASAIAHHPLLGDALALKGGTAFNLCFGDAPARLSVDLDYNYIALAEREKMLEDRPRIEDAVGTLIQRLGYRVQRSADAFAGRKTFAIYRSVLGPSERVEIDLNFLWRVPLAGVEQAALWQPGELDRPKVQTVSLLELCVGKLLALFDRTAPRDAWDVARFPVIAADTIKSSSFRKWFIASSATLPHPLPTYTRERLATRLTREFIDEQLVPMIATSSSADVEELCDRAWTVVAPFTQLNDDEEKYVNEIHNAALRPELLFPEDSAEARRLASHPAIRWKVENVRQQHEKLGQRGTTTANDPKQD